MPLPASDPERAVEAATPADLHHLAELFGVGRLADEAGIERLVALREPIQHLARAVDCRPFLVTGDQQAEGADAGAGRTEAGYGSDEGGDGPLHVARPPPVEDAVLHVRSEGIAGPDRTLARRHHVSMAGEAEVGPALAPLGVKIVDRRSSPLLEGQAVAGEAERLERALQHVEGAAVFRCHALAADQRAGKRQRMRERFNARLALSIPPTCRR